MTQETDILASFVARTRLEDIPAVTVGKAKLALLNYLACATGSATNPAVNRALKALAPYAGAARATVIGTPVSADTLTAAHQNTMSSAILAFDETHARSVVHPVGPVASAALALGEERGVDGATLLRALILGVELSSRASLAISLAPARVLPGWSQTGVCSPIGAATAAAVIAALDAGRVRDAIAMGANAAAGLRSVNGTTAVVNAASAAAASGIRAALFAEAGIEAATAGLEHPFGFIALHTEGGEGYLGYLTEGLGASYAVDELNFKPYPCGIVAHAAIDCALKLRAMRDASSPIQEIAVQVHPSSIALGDRSSVGNPAEAMVSIQYWVATALLRDDIGPDCLEPDWMTNEARLALMPRVRLIADERLARSAARVKIRDSGGQTLGVQVDDCLGSEGNPMQQADIIRKFRSAAMRTLSSDAIERTVDDCLALERLENIRTFLTRLQVREAEHA